MRCTIVRVWASLATALLTAAVADAGTEFAENLGWLGGTARDLQHQAVEPTVLLGLVLAVGLAVFVAFAKVASQDPLLCRAGRLRALSTDLVLALGGSALFTIAMEGYETSFGGISPFDPRSVVLSHAFPLLVAFVLVAIVVQSALGAALRVAVRAGELAAGALGQFFYKAARIPTAPATVYTPAFGRVLRFSPATAGGACGMRAPPRSTLHRFIA